MADKLIVDGVSYEIPEEDDWELGELGEFGRLRDLWGDMGVTIALVWIVKHRADPSFTIEQAQRIKVGQIEEQEAEDDADPLAIPDPSENGGIDKKPEHSPVPSEIPAGSGIQ